MNEVHQEGKQKLIYCDEIIILLLLTTVALFLLDCIISVLNHRKGLPTKIGPEFSIGGRGCNKNLPAFAGYMTELNGWDRPLSDSGKSRICPFSSLGQTAYYDTYAI